MTSTHLGQQHRSHGRGRVGVGCARCAWHHKYDKRLTYLLPRAESGEGEPYWLAVVLVINWAVKYELKHHLRFFTYVTKTHANLSTYWMCVLRLAVSNGTGQCNFSGQRDRKSFLVPGQRDNGTSSKSCNGTGRAGILSGCPVPSRDGTRDNFFFYYYCHSFGVSLSRLHMLFFWSKIYLIFYSFLGNLTTHNAHF